MKLSEIEGIHCSDCATTIAYCEKLQSEVERYERHLAPIRAVLGVEYNGEIKAKIGWLQYEVERLRRALEKIQHEEGRVCNEYEVCNHSACKSSYNSWAIAQQALNNRSDKSRKHEE